MWGLIFGILWYFVTAIVLNIRTIAGLEPAS